MIADLALFAAGLLALAVGADWMVSGSSRLAGSLGLPPLVTGLTVVAFGTSAPELVVSVDAAWRGQGGLAVGNVMGSTVANVGLIVGLSALLAPVTVHRRLLARETPLVVVVLAAVIALSYDASLGRPEGLALLGTFAAYLFLLLRWALPGQVEAAASPGEADLLRPAAVLDAAATDDAAPPDGSEEGGANGPGVDRLAEAGRALLGLAGLLLGSHGLVKAATSLAGGLGVPEAVVGASLVAVGTSLPELASSVAAALRGLGDVAVGNVIGSNVFNLSLVLGAAAVARPIDVDAATVTTQVIPALAFSLLLVPLAYTGRRVGRVEGGLLLASYVAFLVWIF